MIILLLMSSELTIVVIRLCVLVDGPCPSRGRGLTCICRLHPLLLSGNEHVALGNGFSIISVWVASIIISVVVVVMSSTIAVAISSR